MPIRSVMILPIFLLAALSLVGGCAKRDNSQAQNDPPTTPQLPQGNPEPIRPATPEKKSDPSKKEDPPATNDQDKKVDPTKKVENVKNMPMEDETPETPGTKDGKDKKDGKKKDEKPETPAFVPPTEVLGRSFEQWRKQLKAADPTRREEAMRTILAFGPDKAYEALPDIIGELKKHKPPGRVDLSVCITGVTTMSTILAAQKEPDPKLVDDALGVYKTFLKDDQVLLKARAVQGVLALGPKAQDALEDVMKVARDGATWDVRREGLLSLGKIAAQMKTLNPKVPAELHKAVNDNSLPVRMLGLQTILALKDKFDAKEIKNTVDKIETRAKKEEDPGLQIFAYNTIMTLTGEVKKAHLDPILKLLTHKEPMVRLQALQAIKTLGPKGEAALDDVIKIARKADTWEMRKEGLLAVMALSLDKEKLNPKGLVELTHALSDPSPELRLHVLEVLATLKPVLDKKDIGALVGTLEKQVSTEKEAIVRVWMNATIVTLTGEFTQARLDPIMGMLKHKEVPVRLQALQVLALGGKLAKPIVLNAIVEAIRDPDVTVSVAAVDALPNLHAIEMLPMLRKIMEDKKSHPDLIEAAEDAVAILEEIIALEKAQKEKKTPEKK